LIHVASNQPGVDDETFAKGFGWVADRVYALRGVRVGFTLDALPPDHNASFKPSPKKTGPLLAEQTAVLAIQPFIPEVFRGFATGLCRDPGSNCDARDGLPQLEQLIAWKRDYISDWVNTGIPVILDVSSGYDARHVFAASNPPRYGNNEPWRLGQEQMLVSLGVRGLTGNAWNGYTEALAFVPSCTAGPPDLPFCGTDAVFTEGRKAFDWFRALTPAGGSEAKLPAKLTLTSPATAAYSDPLTLQVQLTSLDLDQALFSHPPVRIPVGGRVVRLSFGKQRAQMTTDRERHCDRYVHRRSTAWRGACPGGGVLRWRWRSSFRRGTAQLSPRDQRNDQRSLVRRGRSSALQSARTRRTAARRRWPTCPQANACVYSHLGSRQREVLGRDGRRRHRALQDRHACRP